MSSFREQMLRYPAIVKTLYARHNPSAIVYLLKESGLIEGEPTMEYSRSLIREAAKSSHPTLSKEEVMLFLFERATAQTEKQAEELKAKIKNDVAILDLFSASMWWGPDLAVFSAGKALTETAASTLLDGRMARLEAELSEAKAKVAELEAALVGAMGEAEEVKAKAALWDKVAEMAASSRPSVSTGGEK